MTVSTNCPTGRTVPDDRLSGWLWSLVIRLSPSEHGRNCPNLQIQLARTIDWLTTRLVTLDRAERWTGTFKFPTEPPSVAAGACLSRLKRKQIIVQRAVGVC
jgi:hypothetical protein